LQEKLGFGIIFIMNLEGYIEHTLLKPDATRQEIEKLIREAKEYKFYGICVNPCWVEFARERLENSDVKLVTVVNFPLGSNHIKTTVTQTFQALSDGADEIDTVINISKVKEGRWERVKEEISETKKACSDHILKVILETDLLTKDEIEKACEVCVIAGADFVKTSTGFVKNGFGATVENVRIMANAVSRFGIGVKASGGIKTKLQAQNLIDAGATRLGTSAGVEIIKGK
jgi:deoxyribose-phosphate aldolase